MAERRVRADRPLTPSERTKRYTEKLKREGRWHERVEYRRIYLEAKRREAGVPEKPHNSRPQYPPVGVNGFLYASDGSLQGSGRPDR